MRAGGTQGLDDEYLQEQGIRSMPQQGVNAINGARSRGRLAEACGQIRKEEAGGGSGSGDSNGAGGVPGTRVDSGILGGGIDYLRTDEAAAKTYLPGDRAPKLGEVFRNPDLAWSLEQIAQHGREAFYKGEIAAKILDSMKRHNGPMTAQDWPNFQRIC